jgi:transposase
MRRGDHSSVEDTRDVLNCVLWVMRTGAPWHDLPDCDPRIRRVKSITIMQRLGEGLQE